MEIDQSKTEPKTETGTVVSSKSIEGGKEKRA